MRKYIILLMILVSVNAFATDPDNAGTYDMQAEDVINQILHAGITDTDTSIIIGGTSVASFMDWFFPSGDIFNIHDGSYYPDSLYDVTLKFICRTDATTEGNGDTAMVGIGTWAYKGYLDYIGLYDTLMVTSATWDTSEITFDYVIYPFFYIERYWIDDITGDTTDFDSVKYIEIDSVITEWEKAYYYKPTYKNIASYEAMTDSDEVTLTWDANSETDLDYYILNRGFGTNQYIFGDTTSDTTYSYTDLQDDSIYYFAVVAVDTNGYTSGLSNEVIWRPEPDTTYDSSDVNFDNFIDYKDFARMAFYMGKATSTCDLDGDNDVDEDDWDLFVASYLDSSIVQIGDDD